MTKVTIRRIGNGWLLETNNLDYYFDNIAQAGEAAKRIADLPSEVEELEQMSRAMREISKMMMGDGLLFPKPEDRE